MKKLLPFSSSPLVSLLIIYLIFLLPTESGTAQTVSNYIVTDQFGYLPESEKIAVIRDPVTGFDSGESFSPGASYALVDALTLQQVYTSSPIVWKGGAEDGSSGDCAWWFDFSSFTDQGLYYVLDVSNNVRSQKFRISSGVYNEILKKAVRAFYYQRAGFKKALPYAEQGWTDGASHIGPLQDKNCRIFNDPDNAGTERDLHGGWYDAGDYNKYTSWTANYIVEMMKAWLERPEAWADNYNLPGSGNGIPDLLDEARWGTDYLLRLQEDDGSVLSIVGLAHASPPSAATGQSLYGPASTSATLNTAAAFALSAKVFNGIGLTDYADTLTRSAEDAWAWADANPSVLFRNNDADYGSEGLGAGQQEVDDFERSMAKLEAACFLFDLTGNILYRDYFDNHYEEAHLIQWNYAYPFETTSQEALLYYTQTEGASAAVVNDILTVYRNAMNNSSDNVLAYTSRKDPYLAHIKDYTWGSNSVKAGQGNMFYNLISYDSVNTDREEMGNAASHFIHYLHGVNPLGIVYLSNMYRSGGDRCVNEFYHSWFSDGSPLWDCFRVSAYGPAPGFLTGGPNPSYDWDGCCPNGCGSTDNNSICTSEPISPPKGQPSQKSYKDFNTSWPLNSWSVTENSGGYQVNYIRLLSKYVHPEYDCSGEQGGTATFDVCGNCSGGNTGIVPETDPDGCVFLDLEKRTGDEQVFKIYPNPAGDRLMVETGYPSGYALSIIDLKGRIIMSKTCRGPAVIDTSALLRGNYFIVLTADDQQQVESVLIY